MSVKEYNKQIIVNDTLNGEIIANIDRTKYKDTTIIQMIKDLIEEYLLNNEHGIMLKIGYKN